MTIQRLEYISGLMRGYGAEMKKNWRKLIILVVPAIVSVLVSLYGFGAFSTASGCDQTDTGHGNLIENFSYNWLMSHRMPHMSQHDIALVTISEGSEPLAVLTNTCRAREYLSALVRQLDRLGPRVIAIDMSYSEGSCLEPATNDAFRAALESVGPNTTVVVGQGMHRRANAADQDDCLVLTAPFRFNQDAQHKPIVAVDKVSTGLLRLNSNGEKIPLQWFAFPDDKDASKSKGTENVQDGFAFVIAKQYQPEITENKALQKLIKEHVHPYTTLITNNTHVSAKEVMCYGNPPAATLPSFVSCEDSTAKPIDVRGRIVIVGEHIASERKPFPGGEQYGMDLHASYVESLLHGEYVHEVALLDWSMVIAFCAAVLFLDGMLLRYSKKEGPVLMLLVACTFVLLLFSYLLLDLWGWFTPRLFLSCLSIGSLIVGRLVSLIFAKHTEQYPPQKEGA